MIEWYQNLYLDSVTSKKVELYKNLVMDGKIHIPPVYCVCIACNRSNLLDIISCNELRNAHYQSNELRVIGLSASYKESLELVKQIIMNVYRETGDFDVRSFYG